MNTSQEKNRQQAWNPVIGQSAYHHNFWICAVKKLFKINHKNTQTENALARLFDEEGCRIVFWDDPEREFFITLSALITHFSKIQLANKDLEDPDILGDAYEYLIAQW